jgi:nicotinamidase-related amidase
VVRLWDRFLTESDQETFRRSGFGGPVGFGERPVLLVVDVNYNFCGEYRLPLHESVARWPSSCGPQAWDAVARTRTLIEAARGAAVPVFFSTGMREGSTLFDRGRWNDKSVRSQEHGANPRGNDVVDELAPLPHEIVLRKGRPSAFFGTMLTSYLVDLGADSLVVCGTTTSGCVRATVTDAFSYNFRVTVVEECTFDRGEASHAISLFDIHQKYADVLSLEDVLERFAALPGRLYSSTLLGPELSRGATGSSGSRDQATTAG